MHWMNQSIHIICPVQYVLEGMVHTNYNLHTVDSIITPHSYYSSTVHNTVLGPTINWMSVLRTLVHTILLSRIEIIAVSSARRPLI